MFIYGTYVLEGEADAKFSLGHTWNLLQEDPLPNNASNFCRQMINCMRAWNYIQKTSGSPLNTEIIKQTHKIMMEHRDGKDVLAGEYRKLSVFAGYHIIYFHKLAILKDTWMAKLLDFMKLKRMIQLWPLQICLETLSIYIHLKMETEEFVA